MSAQLEFFEFSQSLLPDGRIVITPKRYAPKREVGVHEAARILGLHRQTVSDLCKIGELDAWKMKSRRNNAKWRIDLSSLDAYRERQKVLSRVS